MDCRRRIRKRLVRAVCLTLVLTFPSLAVAQEVGPALLKAAQEAYQQQPKNRSDALHDLTKTESPAPDESDWKNLSQLPAGVRVAVKTKDKVTHLGEFVAYSEEAITLQEGKRQVTYLQREVRQVSQLGAPNRRRAAWIGLGIGLAAGMVVGIAATAREEDFTGVGVLLISLGTGGIGAGSGAAVGAAAARSPESVVYRAKP